MKKLLLATSVALTATSASAVDLGYGLSLGGDVDVNYITGVEDWAMDFTPSLGFNAYGTMFTAETTIDILELDSGDDIFTGIDFKAEYELTSMISAYGEVSSDKDFEFSDITLGATFSF